MAKKVTSPPAHSRDTYGKLMMECQNDLALLNSILESAPFGVAFFNTQLQFIKVNPIMAKINGKRVKAHLGKTFTELMGKPAQSFEEYLHKVLKTGEPIFEVEFSTPSIKKPEQVNHWLADYIPICADKKLIGVAALIFEVTNRKEAEAKLQHQANLLENVSDAIIATDLDYNITSWNTAAEKLYGWKAEEAIGENAREIIPTTFITHAPEAFRSHVYKAGSWQGEVIQRRRDGVPIDILASVSLVRDSTKKVVGMVTVNRDMTEIKQTEEALRFLADATGVLASSLDYETNLRQVAELAVPTIADWCIVHLLEGDGSLSVSALSHSDPDKVKWAWKLSEKYPPDPESSSSIITVIKTGKPDLISTVTPEMIKLAARSKEHYNIIKKLGMRSYLCVPMKAENKVYGAITLVAAESGYKFSHFDLSIAEELAGRAALAIVNARLFAASLQAVEVRDEFISIASHELKTPLTSIKAFVQLLQKRFRNSNDLKSQSFIEKVHVQIDKLTQLVTDLLDVTKIQAGKLSYNIVSFDIGELVKTVCADFQDTIDTHTITCQVLSVQVEADKDKITQVLTNFLSNAVKYSPNAKAIEVIVSTKSQHVRVAVKDHGIGIAKEHLPKVFERFFRAGDKEAGTMSSLGLGLYISSEIIKDHDGKIGVLSAKGKGSTFYFELPLK
ncbi:MAG TPA: PAS domain S-box protein [Vitreimonas sp.]|nr:PAS domain S-box protein [Vitreimonas sp.]